MMVERKSGSEVEAKVFDTGNTFQTGGIDRVGVDKCFMTFVEVKVKTNALGFDIEGVKVRLQLDTISERGDFYKKI